MIPFDDAEIRKIAEDVLTGWILQFLAAAAGQDEAIPARQHRVEVPVGDREPQAPDEGGLPAKAREVASAPVSRPATPVRAVWRAGGRGFGRMGFVGRTAKLPALQLDAAKLADAVRQLESPPGPAAVRSARWAGPDQTKRS